MSTHNYKASSLRINKVANQVELCDFQIEDPHGAITPSLNQAVQIDEGGQTAFVGDIADLSVEGKESPYDVNLSGAHTGSPVGARVWTVRAEGLSRLAFRVFTGDFSAQVGVPISTVVQTLAGILGIDYSITAPDVLTGPFLSNNEPVASALSRLADLETALTGTPYLWRIAWPGTSFSSKQLQFQPTTYATSSGVGGGGYKPRAGTLKIRYTREQFSNWIVTKLDHYLQDGGDTQSESFTGANVLVGFLKLSKAAASQPRVVIEGAATQTVGVYGVDTGKDWYWTLGSPYLRTDKSISGSALIDVDYIAQDHRIIEQKNNASIAAIGPFQSLLTVGDSNNTLSPSLLTQAEASRRNANSTIVTCEVDCPVGAFQSGQTVSVNVAIGSHTMASGNFYLQAVSHRDEEKTKIWTGLTLVQGPAVYTSAQFMSRLTR